MANVNSVSNTPSYNVSTSLDTPAASANSEAGSQDRFLTLLVAQLNNQDPMNPMDNAQMTSQIAQINTVTGINKLNETMTSMASQFASMQVLQGSTLVGRDVITGGNVLSRDGDTAAGGFELSGPAASVTVEVLSSTGQVLGSMPMGSLGAGRHSFDWDASGQPAGSDLRFRVNASNAGTGVATTLLSRDRVVSVGSEAGQLQLQLSRGSSAAYSDILAVL